MNASINFYYFWELNESFVALSRGFPKINGDIH